MQIWTKNASIFHRLATKYQLEVANPEEVQYQTKYSEQDGFVWTDPYGNQYITIKRARRKPIFDKFYKEYLEQRYRISELNYFVMGINHPGTTVHILGDDAKSNKACRDVWFWEKRALKMLSGCEDTHRCGHVYSWSDGSLYLGVATKLSQPHLVQLVEEIFKNQEIDLGQVHEERDESRYNVCSKTAVWLTYGDARTHQINSHTCSR